MPYNTQFYPEILSIWPGKPFLGSLGHYRAQNGPDLGQLSPLLSQSRTSRKASEASSSPTKAYSFGGNLGTTRKYVGMDRKTSLGANRGPWSQKTGQIGPNGPNFGQFQVLANLENLVEPPDGPKKLIPLVEV